MHLTGTAGVARESEGISGAEARPGGDAGTRPVEVSVQEEIALDPIGFADPVHHADRDAVDVSHEGHLCFSLLFVEGQHEDRLTLCGSEVHHAWRGATLRRELEAAEQCW